MVFKAILIFYNFRILALIKKGGIRHFYANFSAMQNPYADWILVLFPLFRL
jgi:hypothetical protein